MSFINSITEKREFATLPTVVERVLQLLENDDADLREVARIIEADPSLTLKIIRVANTPIFGLRSEVVSVHQAITALGLTRIVNIVLGVALFSRFVAASQSETTALMQKFWWHSACTAVVAKSFTKKLGLNFKEFEFLGGLLHDFGKLAMIQYDASLYQSMVEMVHNEQIRDVDAEVKVFGADHHEAGRLVAQIWKLPAELQSIIIHHSHPETLGSYRELTAVVRLADIMCEIWGAGVDEGIESVDLAEEPSWKLLCVSYPKFSELDLEKFTFELEEDFGNASGFLQAVMQ
ncbi:MAG TPA: HDOD domain-containing protein [Patescibacteria group bacterium]|nr:HDOD domain-containing protein [Patescibacteria group bacterium]